MKRPTLQGLKIRIRKLLITLCLLGSFIGCKAQKATLSGNVENSRLQLILQDGYYPTEKLITEIITNEQRLRAFFAELNKTRKPGIPIPEINFKEYQVILVCLGETKGSNLPTLSIKDENDRSILIEIRHETSENNRDKAVMSYPFCLYKLPRRDKKIEFRT